MSEAAFNLAAEKLKDEPKLVLSVPDEKKLEIYALFKQASVGDVNT